MLLLRAIQEHLTREINYCIPTGGLDVLVYCLRKKRYKRGSDGESKRKGN